MLNISYKDYPGQIICGIDEVGRGPLAGPVLACAVVIQEEIEGVRDSKKISAKKRERLAEEIKEKALAIGYGWVSNQVIDQINILQATKLAMQKAVQACIDQGVSPDLLLIDHEHLPMDLEQKSYDKGDDLVYEIACASIVAKVTRDRLMVQLAEEYPAYAWENNKGYGTKAHRQALLDYGPSPYHRMSFLKNILKDRK